MCGSEQSLNWTRRTLPSRYRPALGVEAALEEIVKNKGRQYDPVVVDARLRVFREQGFAFSKKKDAPPVSGSDIPRAVAKAV